VAAESARRMQIVRGWCSVCEFRALGVGGVGVVSDSKSLEIRSVRQLARRQSATCRRRHLRQAMSTAWQWRMVRFDSDAAAE
jgi:hypothetical protein